MKRFFQYIAFPAIILSCNTQTNPMEQTSIIGKWKMVKMDIQEGLYFDTTDMDLSLKRFVGALFPGKKILTKEDSASVKDDFNKAMNEFQKIFIEFLPDNKYITNESNPNDTANLEKGDYTLNIKNSIITTFQSGQKKHEAHYKLENGELVLHSIDSTKPLSTIIYKRSE